MAGVVILLGLSSVMSCAAPVYFYINPRKKAIGDGEKNLEEEELQMMRNELSALYKEDEAQQAAFDMSDENMAEDLKDLISLRRGKNYYEEKKSTACSANIHDLAMKVDCNRNAVKQFKLSTCGGGLYKYDYTCLGGIDAKVFDETQTTQKVLKGAQFYDITRIVMDAEIDLRTMYRHNVHCDVGGSGHVSSEAAREMMENDDTGVYGGVRGDLPISQFRYDYVVNPSNHLKNSTQYFYKCLAAPTSGNCQQYETPTGVLKPEDLVSDGQMGLQGMDVKCPGEDQVLTQFQLKAGGEHDGAPLPPLPPPGGRTLYRYDYTCCHMKRDDSEYDRNFFREAPET